MGSKWYDGRHKNIGLVVRIVPTTSDGSSLVKGYRENMGQEGKTSSKMSRSEQGKRVEQSEGESKHTRKPGGFEDRGLDDIWLSTHRTYRTTVYAFQSYSKVAICIA